jgi:hypothetical protein
MNVRRIRGIAAVAAVGIVAAGAYAPATAAPKKKPVTKSYEMQLLPVADPPQGTPSCARPELEGVSIHTETLKTTGAGVLEVKVNKFNGDWDISVFEDGELVGVGDGTSTPNTSTSAGEDVFRPKFKTATTLTISTCNFLGTPSAHGEYKFTYK